MRILTLDTNEPFDLDHLPEEIDDMRFAIFDNSDPKDPDYHYIPLIFLESFNAPALVLKIGEHKIRMPMDWQIVDVYHEVAWYAPKLKNGQMLCVPISDGPKPDCVYFVKDISRNCEIVDYSKAW